ncbi:MAG: PD-(D/E)XK nuclease family transposase [Lachnospiraceae bacterium]|nr:PD-(D/E)XK nuclease family transposase [Lachnospiraceae bacterium]
MSKKKIERMIDGMSLFDDDLMSRVFENNIPATRIMLEAILGRAVHIISSRGQVELNNPMEKGRNIRLDIHAVEENGTHFNCEVQRKNSGADPRRARFNAAMLDSRMLKEGQDFKELPASYVIFMTEKDYFKAGKPLYRIERRLDGKRKGQTFGDGSHILYVNGAYEGDDPIGKLMADFRNRSLTGFNYKVLEDGVKRFKQDKEGREIMCDAVEKYADGRYRQGIRQGKREGKREGIAQGRATLILDALRNGAAPEDLKIFGIEEDEVRKVMEKAGR